MSRDQTTPWAAVTHRLSLQRYQLHTRETFYRSLRTWCFYGVKYLEFYSDLHTKKETYELRTSQTETDSATKDMETSCLDR